MNSEDSSESSLMPATNSVSNSGARNLLRKATLYVGPPKFSLYDLEVIERDAGYIRSSWKYSYFSGDKVIDRYRSRIVVKLKGVPDWKTVQVKCESNWLDNKGWILGYDTRLLEDITVIFKANLAA